LRCGLTPSRWTLPARLPPRFGLRPKPGMDDDAESPQDYRVGGYFPGWFKLFRPTHAKIIAPGGIIFPFFGFQLIYR